MLEIKSHLKDLYRINPDEKSRVGFLCLDMNENISGLPQDFVKEVLSEINPGFLAAYPKYKNLQRKIAAYNNLKPENICLSNGSDAAIKYIFDAYVSSGNKILFASPTFAMYEVYCNMFNARSIKVEYKPDLSFPQKEFIDKISPAIRVAVIVNPNNPTGTSVRHESLIAMVKKAADNNVIVIVDEAYYYPDSIIEQIKTYKNLIVLRTFSKLYGIASLRLGYVAACREIIENLRKVKPTYDVNGLAVFFGKKILDDPGIIQSLIKEMNDGKKYLIRKLSENGVEYKAGNANFVLIKCCDRVGEIAKRLAEKNILVYSGFSQDFLKDYIRVTVGSKKIMDKFWKIFLQIWEGAK